MAKRAFKLSETEIRAFQQAEASTRDAYELKRLQAVRLYGSSVATPQIEEVTGCAARSIRKWSQRYGEQGLAGLRTQWQGENALKLSRAQRAELKARLAGQRPDQVLAPELRVSQGQFWTVSDLALVIEQWYGVSYRSETSYRSLLVECGFSYQKVEGSYRSRPDAQALADFEAELEKR